MSELREAAESVGCELYQVKFHGKHLQIFLDREEGGVDISDCQTVSRLASAILDVHDFGKQKYVLEVSSPGLDRELFSVNHYRRFLGSLAKITFFDEIGQKMTLIGRLEGLDESTPQALLDFKESDSRKIRQIPLADIETARLEIEI